jgi:SAM-dependent methyltransferase
MVTENDKIAWPFILLGAEGADDAHALRRSARTLFDTKAAAYDRARPGYPAELFSDLGALCLAAGSSVLEIGCGTGQATRVLARHAEKVTCVELGQHLAERARENLSESAHVTVLHGAFEDLPLPECSFDLVFSATAFHWLDPFLAYEKVSSLLRPGGHLALATNIHVGGGSQDSILGDLAELQKDACPEIGSWRFPSASEVVERSSRGGGIAQLWTRIDRSFHEPPDVSALFGEPVVSTYEWVATYDTSSYVEMLSTQAPYIALDAERRERFFRGVARAIDDHLGGTVTKHYLAVLAVARSLKDRARR